MWLSDYSTWPSTATRAWGHQTIKYTADNTGGSDAPQSEMFFTSGYMLDMGSVGAFEVAQFHIHMPSEHTVEGQQMDAEIHWVHFSHNINDILADTADEDETYALASALGIMFSLEAEVDSDIEAAAFAFLDWIKDDLDNDPTETPTSADKSGVAPYMNDLLQAVNWNNRWSYSGSLTTPNCLTGVQHNVLYTVLPIKQEHLDAIETFTIGLEPSFYIDTLGNYRVVLDL